MKIRNEIKVGALIIVAVAMLYFGLHYLKGLDVFHKPNIYYAVYEKVDGLSTDNSVMLNGVKVGRVAELQLLPHKNNEILVKIDISQKGLMLPDSTSAIIVNLDLLGSKGIELRLSEKNTYYQPGDTLVSGIEKELKSVVEEKLAPVQAQIELLIEETRDIMAVLQITVGNINETVQTADKAIKKIDHATQSVDHMVVEQNQKISEVLGNLSAITANIRANSSQINDILANVATISDSLTRANYALAIQNASNALQQVDSLVTLINNGEGSLGMLVHDDKLYKNLEQAALEIDKLAEDLRINPERYVHLSVFGRKTKKDDKPKAKKRDQSGQVIPD
ncbi:MAG: MCE family protein [Salibacteraceae bacterium]